MAVSRQTEDRPVVRFGDFELDTDRGMLLRRGMRLKLQPQPFRVLEHLVARAPAILTREELGERIWGDGVHVDLDLSLNYCVRQIRLVLDDSAVAPRFIETLPRQGYRFIGVVELTTMETAAVAKPVPTPPALAGGAAGVTEKAEPGPAMVGTGGLERGRFRQWQMGAAALLAVVLAGMVLGAVIWQRRAGGPARSPIESLAVLPLENLSGDPAQEYFADGLTDELITMLAKSSTLRIPSRTSVMQYKGVHRPLPAIARELGVDAVLEGSLVRTGDHVHLNVQLIRAANDTHLWAESYDRDLRSAVTLPREAALTIARELGRASPRAVEARP